METKFDLHLCANYRDEKIKSAVVNCVLTDYLIEKLRIQIKKYSNEDSVDLFYILEYFKNTIEKGNIINFAGIDEWEQHKTIVFQDCFTIAIMLDDMVSKAGLINSGSIVEELKEACKEYSVVLGLCDINCQHINLSGIELREEYIDNLKSQLLLVDEAQFMTDITGMKMDVIPLDTVLYRHKHIEQRLDKTFKVVDYVNNYLDREFDKLHNDIVGSYNKFYKIAYSSLSDIEKVEASRKICKLIDPHRKGLDRMENKLTVANETKRQLIINEKKLREEQETKLQVFERNLQERPHDREQIERERESFVFVLDEYFTKINKAKELVDEVANKISERYNIVDKIDIALRAAIPTESEMKRFSGIAFKYEDLYVRLETAKSQIKNKDEEFNLAIKTAMLGLKRLSLLAKEGKDLFVRNSLLSMVFNCVNGIYDLVDSKNKSVEIQQVKYVTARLVKYSILNNTFIKDLRMYRHINNNAIRDIAILMGKTFTLSNMVDVVEAIELSINQVEELYETINKNHIEQTDMLREILNVN